MLDYWAIFIRELVDSIFDFGPWVRLATFLTLLAVLCFVGSACHG